MPYTELTEVFILEYQDGFRGYWRPSTSYPKFYLARKEALAMKKLANKEGMGLKYRVVRFIRQGGVK